MSRRQPLPCLTEQELTEQRYRDAVLQAACMLEALRTLFDSARPCDLAFSERGLAGLTSILDCCEKHLSAPGSA